MMNKMAELKFEAPLAQFEESDEWTKMMDDELPPSTTAKQPHHHHPGGQSDTEQLDNMLSRAAAAVSLDGGPVASNKTPCAQCGAANNNNNCGGLVEMSAADSDNFGETFSGSLEDLVHTFDDKITRCFCDYEESVEKLAPVQIRTQEEIMNECQ